MQLAAWPHFDDEDLAAVERVLRSGRITYRTGDEGRKFEQEYAAYVGTKYAIAVANGTVALELALRALGIGPGDEVITSSRTFVASASCALLVGARPVFADVDRDSQNLTAQTIERKITPRTRAIIAVHLAGWPCDMDSILALARKHNLYVIEDCAQAHGARYKGRPVGSIGSIGAFSFCQDKIITTGGEGGMITLNDDAHWKVAWSHKDDGKSYDAVHKREHPAGYRWVHESVGTNWRLTEMQSALGRCGLRRLDEWVQLRRRNAAILRAAFSKLPVVRIPESPSECHHSYYKFYAFIEPDTLNSGWSRDRIMQELNHVGVPCSVGSCSELYREKAFATPDAYERLSIARELGETSLMFLVHPTLTVEAIHWIGDTASQVLKSASR